MAWLGCQMACPLSCSLHTILTVSAFAALSFACFSRYAVALSRTAFFLALLGVMTALSLAFS